ncbi:MAG: DedA family protein [Bythopirellula sp.]
MDFLLINGSYFGIILFLVLTGCGLPIPEEVPIILAGVLSSQGRMEPELAFAACLFGALLGDTVMYLIGYHFGHGLLAEHPKLGKFVGADREEEFEHAILRHGFKVMLLARFMVGVRGPVYLAAGTVRMPYRRFILWDLICATLVVGTFFSLSYFYGEHITQLIRDAEVTFTLIVFLIGLSIAWWWMRRRRHHALGEAIDRRAEDGPLTKLGAPPADPAPRKPATNKSTSEDVA